MKRLATLIFLIPFTAGCIGLIVGGAGAAGAYAWINGNLSRNYKQPMETTLEGVLSALRVLRLNITERKHDAFDGYVTAKMVKGKNVRITLERWTNSETRVTVRVGALGDRDVAMKIHEQIESELR